MLFTPPLIQATLLKRYKRFLADVVLETGETLTVHCPNTGSMKNCVVEHSPCWLSDSNNPKRKYRYTWELASTPGGFIAGVNTQRANKLVVEAIENGVLPALRGYETLETEKRYGEESSRIDILLSNPDQHEQCYVEVKSVTLEMEDGLGAFPDAVSERARKHLRELMVMRAQGQRAVLVFCAQHTGIERVAPADHIDPKYGETLREAVREGVEVVACQAKIDQDEIAVYREIPVVLD